MAYCVVGVVIAGEGPSKLQLVAQSHVQLDEVARVVVLTPDGTKMAYGGSKGVVHITGTTSGKEVHRIGPLEAPISSASFSGDGSMLAVTGTSNIPFLLGLGLVPIGQTDQGSGQTVSDEILRGRSQGTVEANRPLLFKRTNSVSPMRARAYLIDFRGREPHLEQVARFSAQLPAVHVAVDRTSISLLTNGLEFLNVSTLAKSPIDLDAVDKGELLRRATGRRNAENRYPVSSTSFSDDGKKVVTLDVDRNGRIIFRSVDPQSGKMRAFEPRPGTFSPWTVDLSRDGQKFVSGGLGRRVQVRNYGGGEILAEFDNSSDADSNIKYVKFSNEASAILTFDDRSILRLWRSDGSALLSQMKFDVSSIRCATIQDDRLVVAFGGVELPAPGARSSPLPPSRTKGGRPNLQPISIFIYRLGRGQELDGEVKGVQVKGVRVSPSQGAVLPGT